MNMPNRASRHQAIRLSRVFIDSRHHAASGLSLDGSPKVSCLGAGVVFGAGAHAPTAHKNAAVKNHERNKRIVDNEGKFIIKNRTRHRGGTHSCYETQIDLREKVAFRNYIFNTTTVSIASKGFAG